MIIQPHLLCDFSVERETHVQSYAYINIRIRQCVYFKSVMVEENQMFENVGFTKMDKRRLSRRWSFLNATSCMTSCAVWLLLFRTF